MSRRSIFVTALFGALVGALLVGVVPAVAGVGDPLLLGRDNSGGKKTTDATATVSNGPGFRFTNTAGGPRAAVRIDVANNAPPFATNSTGRVKKLNADLLDGKQGDDYGVIAAGASSFTSIDTSANFVAIDTDITVPTSGTLMMWAAADTYGLTTDTFSCRLRVDGVDAPNTEMAVTLDYAQGNGNEDCTTSGHMPVTAGTHNVDLFFEAWQTPNHVADTNLSVIFVPGQLQT